ncbi:MAG: hypothetical protein ACLGHN_16155 [Bacteriovoracia bacterium]
MTFLFLLFPILSFAHIVQDDVSITEKSRHSFKTVCAKMFSHDSPLIEVASGTVLDCMGKKLEVGKYCEKAMAADPYYLRAYIDQKSKEVVCVSGKKVLFKYQCVKLSDKSLCSQEAKASCKYIQGKLAKRLDLVHFSFVKNEKGIKELNCFFESLPLAEKFDL